MPVLAANQNMDFLDAETTFPDITFGFNDNYLFANKLDAKSLDYGLIEVEEPTPLTKPFKFLAASDTALNYFAYYGAIISGYPVTYKGSQAVAPKKISHIPEIFLCIKLIHRRGNLAHLS